MEIKKLNFSYASKISKLYNDELEYSFLLGSVYQSPKLTNYLAFLLDKELECFLGIIQENKLLAVVQYRKLDDCLHINNIVVSSASQGIGLGKLLFSSIIEEAIAQHLNISLDVDGNNRKALTWYKSMGFTIQRESSFSVFQFKNHTSCDLSFVDHNSFVSFGFSNVYIAGLDSFEFFWIEPNTFRFKSYNKLSYRLLNKLSKAINGLLVIDSGLLPQNLPSTPIYKKVVYRMKKNVI